jgi:hypothetical protein
MARAQAPSYRFRPGQILGLNYTANASPSYVRGVVGVRYDDGLPEDFVLMATSLTTTRATFVIYPGTQQTLAPTQTFYKPGFVEYAQVVQGGATKIAQRGQLYCSLVIADLGSFENTTLAADYLFTGNSLTLGVVVPPGPAGGHGMMTSFSLGDPAAGTEFATVQSAAGQMWKIRGMICSTGLVTDATAGNRMLTIRHATPSGLIVGGGHSDPIPPSSTSPIIGTEVTSAGVTAAAVGQAVGIQLPTNYIAPTDQLVFVTRNLAAADNYGLGTLDLEEWVMPN